MSQVDEARAMLDSPTMKAAIESARMETYLALAGADPNEPSAIMEHQATLRALDRVTGHLRGIINRHASEQARKNARK